MHYWQKGSLPLNRDACYCIASAMDELSRSNVDAVLTEFFPGGRNHRLEFELGKAKASYEKRAGAAKKRWNGAKDMQSTSNAYSLHKESESQSESQSGRSKPIAQPSLSDLELIYQEYPRRVGKRAALAAIKLALSRLEKDEYRGKPLTREQAIAGLKNRVVMFAQSAAGRRGSFTPHPATWFNKSRYLDDPKEWNDDQESIADSKALNRARNNQAAIRDGLGFGQHADAVCSSAGSGSNAGGDETLGGDVLEGICDEPGVGISGTPANLSVLSKTSGHK
jgi:uncharacterized protein YdaU (DUF1376 family)